MPKQIQIGYDKVPAPITKQYPQLVDIEGIPLTDAAGNPLLTEEDAVLGSFANAESALSVVANNKGAEQAIPVIEQFPVESEVSNSLLGIPRAEEQLSLFSDVSTYGLDEDNWNYYTFSDVLNDPREWYIKENAVHGRRRYPNFNEGSEEQALYLESFPSQHIFPTGTVQNRLTEPTNTFKRYMNFIVIGKILYRKFINAAPEFARLNFLSDNINIVTQGGDIIPIEEGEFGFTRGIRASGVLINSTDYFDVDYGENLQTSFDEIEKWTQLFLKITDDVAQFPSDGGGGTSFIDSDQYKSIQTFCVQECVPGGSSTAESFAILESKKTFRYQPGRVSGFTFGIRLQADPSSSANYIEWGCSNATDEYMFQLIGSRLNIVRRSTIPFPEEILKERYGLESSDQKLKYPVGLGNSVPLHETVFERRSWNGDKLDGTGRSGYILSFEDVTMYKIEFSWYGAIGAKFYAYVPSGNGEARWVLMHTLVIENGLDGPVMQNPDMKFKYLLYATNTARITDPLYIYKYGSSYYIDGGDEGTISLSTFTADTKQFLNRKPIIGLLPKEEIFNQDGIGIENYKKGYPDRISVSSDVFARIDIEEVLGSPNGQHYIFQPSLVNGKHPFSRTLPFIFGTEGPGGDPAQDEGSSQIVSLRESELPEVTTSGLIFNALSISHPTVDLNGFQPGDEIIVSGSTSNDDFYLVLDVNYNSVTASDIAISSSLKTITSSTINFENEGFEVGDNISISAANANNGFFEISNVNGGTITVLDPNTVLVGETAGTEITVKQNSLSVRYLGEGEFPSSEVADSATVNIKTTGIKQIENEAKLIADGIYNIHLEYSGNVVEGQRLSSTILRRSDYDLGPDTIGKLVKSNGEIVESKSRFDARVSAYNTITASTIGISANEFIIHFLVPNPRDGETGGRHYADFGITFTEKAPAEVQLANESRILYGQNQEELNLGEFPFVEYTHYSSRFNIISKAEDREWDPAFGERFMIDSRIPSPVGGNSGYHAAVKGRVTVDNYPINSAQTAEDVPGSGDYRIFFSSGTPNEKFLNSNETQLTSEVGINGQGTGWFYVGLPKQIGTDTYIVIRKVDTESLTTIDDINTVGAVQTKQLILEDMWQLESFPSGVEIDLANPPDPRFDAQDFTVGRSLKFNSQPLYLVLAMKDYAQINNITVEEITQESRYTHTPKFIVSSNITETKALVYDKFGNSSEDFPPSNFDSDTRLSGIRYDSQTENPLRPGTVLYSFYIEPNKPESFDLSNIFNFDRKFLARGQLNNKAIFFTATSVDGVTGNIEMTLTTKEQ